MLEPVQEPVQAQRVATGPPATLVVEVPDEAHLLAAAAGPDLETFLAALMAEAP